VRELVTGIEIAAPPAAVWTVLTDFASYPSWNPFIREIEGPLREGGRLRVRLQPPGGRAMSFRPVLQAVDPERELRWLGRVVLPGVFDGEHRFTMTSSGPDRVRFEQAERFSGVLVPVLGRALARTKGGFEAMNQALKGRAEGGEVAAPG
jgi:hypothetical protein